MIPYIYIPDAHIGPLPLHPFGVLVATGVFLGTAMTTRRARSFGWDLVKLNSFVTWMLVSAFVLSHVLDSLFYHWDEVVKRPWSIFMLWEGLSSFGGFIGAAVGIFLWKYLVIENGGLRVRPKPQPLLPFADLVLSCLPLGWMFGRAGCASVHDHKGARATADSLLAVAWPTHLSFDPTTGAYQGDGTVTKIWFIQFIHGHEPRFDLGLLEFFFTVILTTCFALTWRKRLPLGSYMIVTALAYPPVRFAMDYLRIPGSEGGDTRYLGLTPAQYGCIGLFLFGIGMIFYVRRLRASGIDLTESVKAPPPEPETSARAAA
jgi:phosphatidylglycerol---prolipoprotein diacylglyceryl transferase